MTPEFRVTGKQPELWSAATGDIRKLPAFEQKSGATAVPMKLAPYESAFVVFFDAAGQPSDGRVEANYPTPVQIARLDGPWTVDFLDKVRGPKEPVVFEALTDWTTNSDDLIKYYSGTAVYKSSFKLDAAPDGNHILIDLGDFVAMARVKVNGQDAGGLWTAPYTLDITDLVKAGDNEVEDEVVNTWLNRLIGDLNRRKPNARHGRRSTRGKPTLRCKRQGLFGPVVIESVDYAE